MGNPTTDLGMAVAQAITGFQSTINSGNGAEAVINIGQLTATLTQLVGSPDAVIIANAGAGLLTLGKIEADLQNERPIDQNDVLNLAGNLVSMAAALAVQFTPLGRAGQYLFYVARAVGVIQLLKFTSDNAHAAEFNRAKSWTWPRDPIILDLDGDGLETVGLAGNVYFDHDGDGVLTQTGWAGANDALLVWDRNGNGAIDTGAELFGDFTPMPNGTLAPNGFAALAALDSNGDGVIDASDPAFHELKLWRDTSQDGKTDSGELSSLADAGIVSLNLANTLKNQNLANGNQLTREGSFTRTDGTTSAMGEFNLATDTFNTKFAEQIEVPEALKTLPNMQGAGNVRELRQAATQSDGVASLLAQFQNAATRAEQKALLDPLLSAWADTSGMAKNLDARAQGQYIIQYEAFGNDRRSDHIDSVGFVAAQTAGPLTFEGMTGALSTDIGASYLSAHYRELIDSWNQKLHALEAFNGQYFFNLPDGKSQTASTNDAIWRAVI